MFKSINAGHQITKPNSHYRTGVGALLRLTLPDEEGPVTLAPQHFLSLGAFDVTYIPGTLIVVGRALVFLQRVGAANTELNAVTSKKKPKQTLSSNHSLNYRWRFKGNQ